jgi:hypothetical protein
VAGNSAQGRRNFGTLVELAGRVPLPIKAASGLAFDLSVGRSKELLQFSFLKDRPMWLITPTGFFSVVCKPGDEVAGELTIRARVRSDLDALRQKYLPSLGEIVENTGTDYRFRAKARREEVKKALAKMVQELDYDNFKYEVAKKQGKYRASVYSEIWNVLYDLQDG